MRQLHEGNMVVVSVFTIDIVVALCAVASYMYVCDK